MNEIKKNVIITPPFTQLSSPYPASPFLSGYLNKKNIDNSQIDLSLETALAFLSKNGVISLFNEIENKIIKKNSGIRSFIKNKYRYIETIDSVIDFLQGNNQTFAYRIVNREFLPENMRFEILNYFSFPDFSIIDYAKLLASLYIDDIFDLASSTVIPFFGLSSYGPKLKKSIPDFDNIQKLINVNDLITKLLYRILSSYDFSKTRLAAITIPFPGNLLSSLKIARFLKNNYSNIKIAIGGGYVNTEFNYLTEKKIFKYFDYICFDEGEMPLLKIIESMNDNKPDSLVRTMTLKNKKIFYADNNIKFNHTGIIPDFKNMPLNKYLSLKETTNVMRNLWSEKGFLKLRFAYGCYHHKCTFCDLDLNYINNYIPLAIDEIINQITTLISQTGINSFHFVDEAMPPGLIKNFCNEIIKRKINIVWWGNIRFEKNFTGSLCNLMSRAGCIAITAGLETANNRILKLMEKGVTIEQIISVCNNFSRSNILVHGYLIYGFPSETAPNAINSLEIIRQMFLQDILNSAHYHRFTLTVHSPITKNPESYNIKIKSKKLNAFANNDIDYFEENQSDIDMIEEGLNSAIFNYNSGNCIDDSVNMWFKKNVKISMPDNFVSNLLK